MGTLGYGTLGYGSGVHAMVLEVALIQVRVGGESAFEAAMVEAAPVIQRSPGYLGHEVQRCLETPGRYLLLVWWETLEAHTVGFRQSAGFGEWRAIIGPHFESPPVVEHYDRILAWPRPSER